MSGSGELNAKLPSTNKPTLMIASERALVGVIYVSTGPDRTGQDYLLSILFLIIPSRSGPVSLLINIVIAGMACILACTAGALEGCGSAVSRELDPFGKRTAPTPRAGQGRHNDQEAPLRNNGVLWRGVMIK
ncbi:hypothetical protein ANO14919_055840 [Xylariales sp. No.14919]|nr:hypothetical protein ANO14919_055840 [Xylariales sp. No.14919]